MLAYILAMLLAPAPACETHTVPSGTHVQTCNGRVSARWDNAGNVRVYGTDGRIYTRVGSDWVVL